MKKLLLAFLCFASLASAQTNGGTGSTLYDGTKWWEIARTAVQT